MGKMSHEVPNMFHGREVWESCWPEQLSNIKKSTSSSSNSMWTSISMLTQYITFLLEECAGFEQVEQMEQIDQMGQLEQTEQMRQMEQMEQMELWHADTGDNNTFDQRPVAPTRKALNLRAVHPSSPFPVIIWYVRHLFSNLQPYGYFMCCGGVVVRLLASQYGEPGSIPGGIAPRFSHVGIVTDDAAARRHLQFPPHLHSVATLYSPHFAHFCSRDAVVKNY
ncbi:hypothetical protein PR048_012331 [Dryococelus australis]|uniref:Uncharacterized protein n=1 Tax=Dryococelus australis TaxID=614101 RepID=A0ABQ9HP73_9NEOP|nr:hypothetical protein PR048_012331 [Dryococelus australis]